MGIRKVRELFQSSSSLILPISLPWISNPALFGGTAGTIRGWLTAETWYPWGQSPGGSLCLSEDSLQGASLLVKFTALYFYQRGCHRATSKRGHGLAVPTGSTPPGSLGTSHRTSSHSTHRMSGIGCWRLAWGLLMRIGLRWAKTPPSSFCDHKHFLPTKEGLPSPGMAAEMEASVRVLQEGSCVSLWVGTQSGLASWFMLRWHRDILRK